MVCKGWYGNALQSYFEEEKKLIAKVRKNKKINTFISKGKCYYINKQILLLKEVRD